MVERRMKTTGTTAAALLLAGAVLAGAAGPSRPASAQDADAAADPAASASWEAVERAARGQRVHLHAWAGDAKINDYLDWAGRELERRFGVTLEHVKVSDIGETVALVLAEKAAGRNEGGRADLVWLNGENFAAMKENGLLYGPWVAGLPNFALVDTEGKPTTLVDFTVPTDGLEAPWGMAQLTFYYDTANYDPGPLDGPPRGIAELADWIEAEPGRFTYPAPPDFTGTTFLKQALIELTPDPSVLAEPVTDAAFEKATAPLWQWLERAHPHLWRGGRAFPANYPALRQLVDDGETTIAFAFNPTEAAAAIEQGLLAPSVRSFTFDGGTIGNTHFLAIPFNASAKAGAMVAANFLLSPQAQARKADAAVWGDPTVLDLAKLPAEDRARFEVPPDRPALLDPRELGRVLAEPHPSWTARIEDEWLSRYSR